MAKAKRITTSYDKLPWIVRVILELFFGAIIGGIYRIIRFVESGNVITLVVGLLVLLTGVGNAVIWVVDFITTLVGKGICLLAD